MKDEKTMKLLKPHYYNEFKCVGSACIHTCCKGWSIRIDESTYATYHNTEGEFGDKLRKNIIQDGEKFKFKLTEDFSCPFLTEQNLCDVYIQLGEDKMCNTCKTYPRIQKVRGDILEQTLTLSCPEVARMLIELEESIEFCFNDNIEYNEVTPTDDFLFNALLQTRSFSIDLIQNSKLDFHSRQLILLIFSTKAQKCIDDKDYSEIPKLIEYFNRDDILFLYSEQLNSLHKVNSAKYNIIDTLICELLPNILRSDPYLMDIFKNQIMNVDGMTLSLFLEKYEEEFSSCRNENSHIYENFYVHSLFRYYLDALDDRDILKQIIFTNIGYIIIYVFQILSYIDSGKSLSVTQQALIMRAFSYALEHDSNSFNAIYNYLKDNNGISAAFQALLLK